jgi:hypothetical protein
VIKVGTTAFGAPVYSQSFSSANLKCASATSFTANLVNFQFYFDFAFLFEDEIFVISYQHRLQMNKPG